VLKHSVADVYFQGDGGTGPPAFFQGDGGTGPPAFFQGDGGTGPPAFATIIGPLLFAVTAVFRLIAPTRTSITNSITVSLRDIVPPEVLKTTPVALYIFLHQCQAAQAMGLYSIDTRCPAPFFR
jgi:hypothetical protein